MKIKQTIEWLRKLGCHPCISKRGDHWRAHINRYGNFWEDAQSPELALEKAVKTWEIYGRPMDGQASDYTCDESNERWHWIKNG